jgi:hypothetical protein
MTRQPSAPTVENRPLSTKPDQSTPSLPELSRAIAAIKEEEDELKARREKARIQFFSLITTGIEEWQLRTTSITVPEEFWDIVDREEFFETRFPQWDIISETRDEAQLTDTFILREKPEYVGDSFEVDHDGTRYKISKQIDAGTPAVDWASLRAEYPEIFRRLAKRVVKYEINEDAWGDLQEEYPEFTTIIQRHTRVKPPTVKLFPRKLKSEE